MKNLVKLYHWLLQPLLVVAILVFGFLGARGFSMFNEEPPKLEREIYAPLVRVMKTEVTQTPVIIRGNGTVEARTRINITPQVGGRITYIHPQLRPGGAFVENEKLIQIEPIDFELAVTQNEAEVAAASTALELEIAEADAAKLEWKTLNPRADIPKLVSRAPQIAEARAQLKAAQAQLQQARLELTRAKINAPFAGRVVEASIDVGEVITANQQIGTIYSSEKFEIPVPLELDELLWVQTPSQDNDFQGSEAKIEVNIGEQQYNIPGRVTRIESELVALSRFARVVVTLLPENIPDVIKDKIIPGLFVEIAIQGKQLNQVTILPRAALRENDVVWTVAQDKLHFLHPNIIYKNKREILVRDLAHGTQIILGDLDVVTNGMHVRVASDS